VATVNNYVSTLDDEKGEITSNNKKKYQGNFGWGKIMLLIMIFA